MEQVWNRPGNKKVDVITIWSSHGELIVDALTGLVYHEYSGYDASDPDCYIKDIRRFNLEEYKENYNHHIEDMDILDIGYWLKDGTYEEPEHSHRFDVIYDNDLTRPIDDRYQEYFYKDAVEYLKRIYGLEPNDIDFDKVKSDEWYITGLKYEDQIDLIADKYDLITIAKKRFSPERTTIRNIYRIQQIKNRDKKPYTIISKNTQQ